MCYKNIIFMLFQYFYISMILSIYLAFSLSLSHVCVRVCVDLSCKAKILYICFLKAPF